MATLANIGFLAFSMRNLTSPQSAYTSIEEVRSVSNLGFEANTLEVTNYDSPAGYKEFIAALKEGVDVTVTCNHRLSSNTGQLALIAACNAGTNREFKLTYTAASPNLKILFTASPRGLKYLPSVTEQNQLEFTLKISGNLS